MLQSKKRNFEEVDTERFQYRTMNMHGMLKQLNTGKKGENDLLGVQEESQDMLSLGGGIPGAQQRFEAPRGMEAAILA